MLIELNPLDVVSRTIYDGYKGGANVRKDRTHPCTICNGLPKEDNTDSIRGHFHGSEFGQCMLKTYRNMTEGKETEIISTAASLIDGHAHESEIFKNLDAGGLNVVGFGNQAHLEKQVQVYVKKNGKVNQRDFTMPMKDEPNKKEWEKSFRMILHLDGLLEIEGDEKENLVGIECKSVKDYTWNKIKKTSEISDIWYGQIQAYMLWNHNITTFYLIVKNRGSSEILKPIRIDRDDKYINRRLNILYRIFNSIIEDNKEAHQIEAEHTSIQNSECKFCPYKEDCYE